MNTDLERIEDALADGRAPLGTPWVTGLIAAASAVIHFRVGYGDVDAATMRTHGAPSASGVWDGDAWGLVTSAVVHVALWHLVFNLYWLWALGRVMEPLVGSLRYLGFVVVAAWVSSSAQLAASDNSGIGLSGVAYAMVAFMATARPRWPAFESVVDARVIQLFVGWGLLCIVLDRTGSLDVGNSAHASGALFGGLLGLALRSGGAALAARAGLVALVLASAVPPFHAPWSSGWWGHRGNKAFRAGDATAAEAFYRNALARDPAAGWLHANLARVLYERQAWGEIVHHMELAEDLDPGRFHGTDTIGMYAYALVRVERWDRALSLLNRFLKARPDEEWALVNRAQVLRELGDEEGAARDARRLAELRGEGEER